MNTQKNLDLDDSEKLELLQLLELTEWAARSEARSRTLGPGNDPPNVTYPSQWSLLGNTTLLPWQEEALRRWSAVGSRGIAKVVTGAGKTVFGLAAIERLQRTHKDLQVAIVVPTIVLMSQWQDEILSRSNLPPSMVGTLGGGSDDHFDGKIRVLICVLNSAARKLPGIVRATPGKHDLLMIVDECHRAGASEMRKLFDAPTQFTLGLSATPERDDTPEDSDTEKNDDESYDGKSDGILEREIGPIFYEMNYAQAISQGVLAAFAIEHYAISLNADERRSYEAISREITDLRQQLETRSRRGLALIRWCRSVAGSKDFRARRLIGLITDRKQLLYQIEERAKAVERLVGEAIERDPSSRIIIFHESIAEVMNIFARLRRLGYRALAEHSELSDRTRAQAISLFRSGNAQILVSAKSLIEGFNVPSADIGIVVAASSSVRQRIQTLGRLLRRGEGNGSKRARLIVLFAENTVDDRIYEKADWNGFVGAERNEYFRWINVEETTPIRVNSAPREYVPADYELDPASLRLGMPYPGKFEGETFTIDTGGTVLDAHNHPVELDQDVMARLSEFRGGGRFLVTPKCHHVLKLSRNTAGNEAIFLGQLSGPLRISTEKISTAELNPAPGDEYPLQLAVGKTFSVLQRDERLIARKERGQPLFVERSDKITDIERRSKLEQIQVGLRGAYRKGHLISKIFVNDLGHVGYLYQGKAYFLGNAPEGPAGFSFEKNHNQPKQS